MWVFFKYNSSEAHCVARTADCFALGHTLFGRKSIVAATFRFYEQACFTGSRGSIFSKRSYIMHFSVSEHEDVLYPTVPSRDGMGGQYINTSIVMIQEPRNDIQNVPSSSP